MLQYALFSTHWLDNYGYKPDLSLDLWNLSIMAGRARYRKKSLSQTPVTVNVESLNHDGRGVAHVDGKVVFIDAALPGETVAFTYTDSHKDYAEGKVVQVLTAAAERVTPECSHYGVCGGCSFQHVASHAQINFKQALLVEQFQRIGKVTVPELWEPLTGPYWGYRCKARMGVKYVAKKGKVLVGFRERQQPFLADIEQCKVMHPMVGGHLLALGALIAELSIREQVPQIEVAIGDEACVLALRVLSVPTEADITRLRAFAHTHGITLCLQPKGPDTIQPLPGEPEVMPTYALPEQNLVFAFKPAMFTQVNYAINRQMINRVLATLQLSPEDKVLDLFCGLGNFTLPLATQAGQVVGIEADLPLIQHAQYNARLNGIANVEFYAADLSRDLSHYPWAQRRYHKVLLDPSRAGAAEVLPYLRHWQPEKIVYVSCNPSTLARDAGILVQQLGYRLVKAGVMDMFPHTAHVESMALFTR